MLSYPYSVNIGLTDVKQKFHDFDTLLILKPKILIWINKLPNVEQPMVSVLSFEAFLLFLLGM